MGLITSVRQLLIEGDDPRRVFKQVSFWRGRIERIWTVEVDTSVQSDRWAVNRAISAMLLRDGVPVNKGTIGAYRRQYEPTVKTVDRPVDPKRTTYIQ